MNDPTPDLVFDLDAVRGVAASTPEPGGSMLTSMADLLESMRERADRMLASQCFKRAREYERIRKGELFDGERE